MSAKHHRAGKVGPLTLLIDRVHPLSRLLETRVVLMPTLIRYHPHSLADLRHLFIPLLMAVAVEPVPAVLP